MNTTNLRISELKAALLFSSTDESRHVLNSVLVEFSEGTQPRIIATDGRRLCVIESEANQADCAGNGSMILASSFLSPFLAFANKTGLGDVKIEFHPPSRAQFTITKNLFVDAHTGEAVIEGTFPKWRLVLPVGEKQPVGKLGLNAEAVADFHKAAKALGKSESLISCNLYSETGSMDVRFYQIPNFYAVVMPCKPAEEMAYQPKFLFAETPPTQTP